MRFCKVNFLAGAILISMPFLSNAATTTTDFTVTAQVTAALGLFCNAAGTGCTPGAVNFGHLTNTYNQNHNLFMMATIAENASSGNIYYKISDNGQTPNNTNHFNMIGATSGNTTTIPLQVVYRPCGAGQNYTYPSVGQIVTLPLANSSIAGSAPVTTDPGAGSYGMLAFTIPAQVTPPTADTYSDVVTVTVCDTSTCT